MQFVFFLVFCSSIDPDGLFNLFRDPYQERTVYTIVWDYFKNDFPCFLLVSDTNGFWELFLRKVAIDFWLFIMMMMREKERLELMKCSGGYVSLAIR